MRIIGQLFMGALLITTTIMLVCSIAAIGSLFIHF